eukprot:tig00021680_g23051.t1
MANSKRSRTSAARVEPEAGESALERLPDIVLLQIAAHVGPRAAFGVSALRNVSHRLREIADATEWPSLELFGSDETDEKDAEEEGEEDEEDEEDEEGEWEEASYGELEEQEQESNADEEQQQEEDEEEEEEKEQEERVVSGGATRRETLAVMRRIGRRPAGSVRLAGLVLELPRSGRGPAGAVAIKRDALACLRALCGLRSVAIRFRRHPEDPDDADVPPDRGSLEGMRDMLAEAFRGVHGPGWSPQPVDVGDIQARVAGKAHALVAGLLGALVPFAPTLEVLALGLESLTPAPAPGAFALPLSLTRSPSRRGGREPALRIKTRIIDIFRIKTRSRHWEAILGGFARLGRLTSLDVSRCFQLDRAAAPFLYALGDRLPGLRALGAALDIEGDHEHTEVSQAFVGGMPAHFPLLEEIRIRDLEKLSGEPTFSYLRLGSFPRLRRLAIEYPRGGRHAYLEPVVEDVEKRPEGSPPLESVSFLSRAGPISWPFNVEDLGRLPSLQSLELGIEGGTMEGRGLREADPIELEGLAEGLSSLPQGLRRLSLALTGLKGLDFSSFLPRLTSLEEFNLHLSGKEKRLTANRESLAAALAALLLPSSSSSSLRSFSFVNVVYTGAPAAPDKDGTLVLLRAAAPVLVRYGSSGRDIVREEAELLAACPKLRALSLFPPREYDRSPAKLAARLAALAPLAALQSRTPPSPESHEVFTDEEEGYTDFSKGLAEALPGWRVARAGWAQWPSFRSGAGPRE